MEKRFQVFMSSTFVDLQEERSKIYQTLMEMDCIPAGMEMFPAADEEQWQFIKKIIDDCDYYLLLIGGRYGSVADDGTSYTEKGYDYAVEKGIYIIALLHEDPGQLPAERVDTDPEKNKKLEQFREKVSKNRLVKTWKTAESLSGIVSLSLNRAIRTNPAIGWVRSNAVANTDLLQQINELRQEKEELLKNQKEDFKKSISSTKNLASGEEKINVSGTYEDNYSTNNWSSQITWNEMLLLLGTQLMGGLGDYKIKQLLVESILLKENFKLQNIRNLSIDEHIFETIQIQFMALNYVSLSYTKVTGGLNKASWKFTDEGKKQFLELKTIKSKNS
jgi:hypothetical protein